MSRRTRLTALLAVLSVLLSLGLATTALAQAAATFTFGPGRDAVQPGTVTLTPRGNQTEVTIQVQSGGAGVQQPAHVHEGGCPGVGAIKYPLTNVVDGRSTTTVNATLDELLSGQYSINVHRSTAEAQVYTACVNLTRAGAQGGAAPATATAAAGVTAPPRTGTAGVPANAGVPGWLLALGAAIVLLGAAGLTIRRVR